MNYTRYPQRRREPVLSGRFIAFLAVFTMIAFGIMLFFIMRIDQREAAHNIDLANLPYDEELPYEPETPGTASVDVLNEAPTPPDDEITYDGGYTNNYNPDDDGGTLAPPPDYYHYNPPSTSPITTVDNSRLPWYLKLVNRYNFLDYHFMPQLTPIGGGHYFDSRAYHQLLAMLDSARYDGLSPIVVSSFRSVSRQTYLFNRRVQRFIDYGYNEYDAFEYARRIVAYPGSSEHNLGLAVDIVAASYTQLTANQANTPEGIWLAENSYRYGFVLRYPDDKQHITNIIFEPWHFRYVGVYAAREMFARGLVLEEYVSLRLQRSN